jgi:hypothetical protein
LGDDDARVSAREARHARASRTNLRVFPMSLIRYLYIGNFETDGEFVRLEHVTGKPIIRRSISQEMLASCFPEFRIATQGLLSIPAAWPVWYEEGYILCKRDELPDDAVKFLHRAVESFRCEIVDVGNGLLLPVNQVRVCSSNPETKQFYPAR